MAHFRNDFAATHVDGRIVAGAGHWLMEEAPQEVMSALVSFLD